MNYQPQQSLQLAQQRAKMLAQIRQFFTNKSILEVNTPILSNAGNTDTFIDSVSANFHQAGKAVTGYLHTSPEFAMKRLLATWQVPIYQLCQVFRDNERGSRHNIEFTMLEWYRPNFDLDALADELGELIGIIFDKKIQFKRLTYKESFASLGIHPFTSSIDELQQCASSHDIMLDMGDDRQGWLDLLFSHLIEPNLGKDLPTLLTDYPPATAALAKTVHDDDGHLVAKRFELYIDGLEIANAYDELADGKELLARFHADNAERSKLGRPIMPIDLNLIHACDNLPACSGIALGIDRLFMVSQKLTDIKHAIAITTDHA
ncbi:EF-P lysine aminoacylase EpmA [Moraxella sp. Pampa]|uniref:EF-P lysine aminoacylase EpmA n=1 Tax=Moraxella sp. Pampa TaxID=3111978 RepID=UPI002B4086A7|nr:EF-P lysine aminoacylase EpmA [Moraxella sp. Pampa]